MLPQKVLMNGSVDQCVIKNDQMFLAIAAHHPQGNLLKKTDAGVHISHREVRQVAAGAAVDGRVPSDDLFITHKKTDPTRQAGLQHVEKFAASLLINFLSVWGQKQPLDDLKGQ
jgi:hypothetical protein